jgi:very-short-patch-repair endonuclease
MLGLKFRRQHRIRGFIVDFYCAELRLVLEIDGPIHEGIANSSYDEIRSAWFEGRGFRVVRLRSRDVSEAQLKRMLRSELSRRSPSPQRGEGVRG